MELNGCVLSMFFIRKFICMFAHANQKNSLQHSTLCTHKDTYSQAQKQCLLPTVLQNVNQYKNVTDNLYHCNYFIFCTNSITVIK